MKTLIAIALLTSSTAFAQCQTYGNTTNCQNGTTYQQYGNTTQGYNSNTGNSWTQTQIGNSTYGQDSQGRTWNQTQQATKNIQRDAQGNPVPSAAAMDRVVRNLDADGKLDYIFGKKGAQEVRDLRDTTLNVYSPVKGAANESNTSSALVRALRGASQSPIGRIPGVGAAAEMANQRQIRKQVVDALRNQ